jgi:hypothetical protein
MRTTQAVKLIEKQIADMIKREDLFNNEADELEAQSDAIRVARVSLEKLLATIKSGGDKKPATAGKPATTGKPRRVTTKVAAPELNVDGGVNRQ